MPFGPPNAEKPRLCPRCRAALPLPNLARCPTCGAEVTSAGEPGKALVDAMLDVLADPLGERKRRSSG